MTKAQAEKISASRSALTFGMTANPKRLAYGDRLTITLTMTNPGPQKAAVSFAVDHTTEDVPILFADQSLWFLPPPPLSNGDYPTSTNHHYAAIVLDPNGVATFRVETAMRAMTFSFQVSCATPPCPLYKEVEWDPGKDFPAGKYKLTGVMSLLGGEGDWATTVEVTN